MNTAEGLRTGRQSTGTESQINVSAASQVFLAANPNRIAFTLGSSASQALTIKQAATVVNGVGMGIPAAGMPVTFNQDNVGNLITGQWSIIAGGASVVDLIEIVNSSQ